MNGQRTLVFVPMRTADEFRRRAEPENLPEWMDEPCSYDEFRACLRDLERVNRLVGAYSPTLGFLDRMAARWRGKRPLRIVDVGSGGGDMLRRVSRWAWRRGVAVELVGVDVNPHAARAAREFDTRAMAEPGIRWVTADAFAFAQTEGVDVVLSSLFTHHLNTPEIVRFLAWMESVAEVGWFVNDLERSARAARWFAVLAGALRWHRFVQHDGPVSIRRAFRVEDWREMLNAAGLPRQAAEIQPHRMARLCVARIK